MSSVSETGLPDWPAWSPELLRSMARQYAVPVMARTRLCTWSAPLLPKGLCLGQQGTRGKGNEIAAIKALLDTLSLKGCIITIDALGCQTEIAQKILERGGDYLLVVKNNQGKLADALRDFFTEADTAGFGTLPVSQYETLEKDHGRIETRRAVWVGTLDWLERPIREHWPKLAVVGMLERSRRMSSRWWTSVSTAPCPA